MSPEIRIIVDNRERGASITARLERLGAVVKLAQAPVGDYILSDRVAVERKTVSDLQSSILDGRLFEQLSRLKEAYQSPFLLIEGDMSEFSLGENIFKGLVAAVCVDYNVSILSTASQEETSDLIYYMAKREQNASGREMSMKGVVRSFSDADFQEHIIGNFPGVGPKLAKSLLLNFKSLRSLANADVKDLMKVDKIGKKKAEIIHRILNSDYTPKNSVAKP